MPKRLAVSFGLSPNKLVSFFSDGFSNKPPSFFSAGFKKLKVGVSFTASLLAKLKVGGSGTLNVTGSATGFGLLYIFGSLSALGLELAAVSNLESETLSSVSKVTTFYLVVYALIIEISLLNKISSSPSGSQLDITRLELLKRFELIDFPRINGAVFGLLNTGGPDARLAFKYGG